MASIAFSGFKSTRALLQPAKAVSKSSTTTSASGAAKAAVTKKKSATRTTAERSKSEQEVKNSAPSNRGSALLRLYPVSPALRSFLGVSETSRPHAIKEIWAYIKRHNLQNHENKREILCDEKLKNLFGGKEKVGFSDVGKMISQNVVKTA